MFAVGNPIVFPRPSPLTTVPLKEYGRPRNLEALSTSPAPRAFLITVLLTVTPSTVNGCTANTEKSNSFPIFSRSLMPAALSRPNI